MPVKEPQRARVLEIRVPPILGQQLVAELRRHHLVEARVVSAFLFAQNLVGNAPVADSTHHVLAHAQRGDGVVAQEDARKPPQDHDGFIVAGE